MTERRLSRTQRYKRTIKGLRTDLDNMTKVATELYGIIQSGGSDQQHRAHVALSSLDNGKAVMIEGRDYRSSARAR